MLSINSILSFVLYLLILMQSQKVEVQRNTPSFSRPPNHNTMLKLIQKCLHSQEPSSLSTLLVQFSELHPSSQATQKLQEMLTTTAIEKCRYRKIIDHFICLIREMHVLAKGQDSLFKERMYYEHLNDLEKLLKKKEIVTWGSEIKQVLGRNMGWSNKANKSSYDLQINLTKQNEVSRDATFNLERAMNEHSYTAHSIPDKNFRERSTGKPLKDSEKSNKELEDVRVKVDMFAMKYELKGSNIVQKLGALDDHIRSLSKKYEKQSRDKLNHFQKLCNQREKQLRDEADRLKKIIQQLKINKQTSGISTTAVIRTEDNKYGVQNSSVSFRKKEPSQDSVVIVQQFLIESSIVSHLDHQFHAFLKEKLFQLGKITPISSTLLFSSQSKQQYINIHQLIDNHPNILLLIKLTNSNIIGGFSREAFHPNCHSNDGFLFSLTHLQAFEKIKGSSIVYNPESIVFGKNQLRIKNKSMSLYSNFGAIERNFHAHNHKIDYFIGNGEGRYTQMTVFEVWEIHTD